jgi:hypothetical protein
LHAVLIERPQFNVVFASDGSPQHWTLLTGMATRLPDGFCGNVSFVIDFFHVREHLAEAANAIAGKETPEARVLATTWQETLKEFDDGAHRVLKSMRYYRDKQTKKLRRKTVVAVTAKLEAACSVPTADLHPIRGRGTWLDLQSTFNRGFGLGYLDSCGDVGRGVFSVASPTTIRYTPAETWR